MKYQIKKWFNNDWYDIDIENVRKDDIIKIIQEDGKLLLNAEGKAISIVKKDSYENEKGWNMESIPLSQKELDIIKKIEILKNKKGKDEQNEKF